MSVPTSSYTRAAFLRDVFTMLVLTVLLYSAVELVRPGVITAHLNLLGLLVLTVACGEALAGADMPSSWPRPVVVVFVAAGIGAILAAATEGPMALRLLLGLSGGAVSFIIGRILAYD